MKKEACSRDMVKHIEERLVIHRDDVGGRARVTSDEE